jgi:hypothetical protein
MGLLDHAAHPDANAVTMPIETGHARAHGGYFSKVGRWIKESF